MPLPSPILRLAAACVLALGSGACRTSEMVRPAWIAPRVLEAPGIVAVTDARAPGRAERVVAERDALLRHVRRTPLAPLAAVTATVTAFAFSSTRDLHALRDEISEGSRAAAFYIAEDQALYVALEPAPPTASAAASPTRTAWVELRHEIVHHLHWLGTAPRKPCLAISEGLAYWLSVGARPGIDFALLCVHDGALEIPLEDLEERLDALLAETESGDVRARWRGYLLVRAIVEDARLSQRATAWLLRTHSDGDDLDDLARALGVSRRDVALVYRRAYLATRAAFLSEPAVREYFALERQFLDEVTRFVEAASRAGGADPRVAAEARAAARWSGIDEMGDRLTDIERRRHPAED